MQRTAQVGPTQRTASVGEPSVPFTQVNGTCLQQKDTNSQVCSLIWSPRSRELVSSHGFVNNQLCLWSYPDMTRVAELTGHTNR